VQLERRCLLRAVMLADKENRLNWSEPELHHWIEEQWHKFIAPDHAPGALFWKPGDALPEYHFTNHLAPSYKRLAQRFVHALCLPLLDSTRPRWPKDAYPRKIESDVQARLVELLRHP
jgi:hypothetical protein